MKTTKLLFVNKTEDNVIRLQSQLMVGRDSVDFIIENGILKNYCKGNNGIDFHKINIPFEIIYNKKDMSYQQL